MYQRVKISDFLHRIKNKVILDPEIEYPLVTIKLHHKGVVLREKKRGELIKSNMYRIRSGQFILSGIDARNGAFGVVPDELDGAIVTNDFWYFDVDESIIMRDFFYWFTNTPLFLDACIKSSKGETQRIRLQKKLFENFEFNIPPLDKQKEFLKRIKTVDNHLQELKLDIDYQANLLKKLRQAILQEAIEGKLTAEWRKEHPELISGENRAERLLERIKEEKNKLIAEGKIRKPKPLPPISDEEKPFELPESWCWSYFQNCIDIKSNLVQPYDYYDLPHVAPNNIEKFTGRLLDINTVKEDDVRSQNHYFYPGMLIYSKVRPRLRKIVHVNFEGLCSADMYPLTSYIDVGYLKYLMLSDFFDFEVYKYDNRVKMPKINQKQLSSIHIPVPALNEQKEIVKRIDKVFKIIDELESQILERKQLLEDLMQTVLREAFEQA